MLVTDADLSTPIEELERLEAALADAELVLGSRAVAGVAHHTAPALAPRVDGPQLQPSIRTLGVTSLHDTQCGFKLLRGDVARRLFAELTVDRFAYDVELVWLARRRGSGWSRSAWPGTIRRPRRSTRCATPPPC